MRPVRLLLVCALGWVAAGQQPIGVGPDSSAGQGAGVVKSMHWYTTTPSGCSAGTGQYCVGTTPQGDSYYFTAWLANASGLPVSNGLPVVGTINDFTLANSPCSAGGNVAVLQFDTFDWATPRTSRMTKVNCMTSYGGNPGATNAPAGWSGKLINAGGNTGGSWKNRAPFSKGGMLYIPVERQIPAGNAAVHDATMIVSPDSGAHWCNPYTYFSHAGSPGCDSSNWQADGDAPKCGAADFNSPCTDTAYLDANHSSMMWKGLPFGTENWSFINWGNQDGKPFPAGAGVKDGCDPNVYTCFMLLSYGGQIARVPNASIMDISAWRYYTCSALTQSYRCPGTDDANWTPVFADATPVIYLTFSGSSYNSWGGYPNPYSIVYMKEFGSYVTFGQGTDITWAPSLLGPWTTIWRNQTVGIEYNFLSPTPALGYRVVSTNPPHVLLTTNSNSYSGGQGSTYMVQWDLVLGKQLTGEAFQVTNAVQWTLGAGFQFSDGHMPGSFPRRGLVHSFDLYDKGAVNLSNWPLYLDRGNYAAVITPCDGSLGAPILCGGVSNSHGTAVAVSGIQVIDRNEDYAAHFRISPADVKLGVTQNIPALHGNSSYTVAGVYRLNGFTQFNRPAGMWTYGAGSSGDNTLLSMDQVNGKIQINWNTVGGPHYQYLSNFTFANFTNWYFVALTVQAQTGCGSNCTPAAKLWVGGLNSVGVLEDALSGVSYTNTPSHNAATKTPNVQPGPFTIGMNQNTSKGYQSSMSFGALTIYSRALSSPEVQLMYNSMKQKMAARGITLQ